MLKIGLSEYEAVRRHGEESYPHECCGVLLGRFEMATNAVCSCVRTVNRRSDSPRDRYSIAPEELLRIQKNAREQGLDIIGFYHSHPDHLARWSETDLREAHWVGCSYVITNVAGGTAQHTFSFRLAGVSEEDKQFIDEPIEIARNQ